MVQIKSDPKEKGAERLPLPIEAISAEQEDYARRLVKVEKEMKNEPRLFKCKVCGWILGEIVLEKGSRIVDLRVYRHPRSVEDGIDLRDIHISIKYSVMRVKDGAVMCEHCGADDGWYANRTAIENMRRRKSSRRMDIVRG